MENVAKGRMVSEWLREKLPWLLGWVGLGNRDPRVGHTSTPSTWGIGHGFLVPCHPLGL